MSSNKIWVKGHYKEGKGYTRAHQRKKPHKKSMEFKAGELHSWLKTLENSRRLLILEWIDRLKEEKSVTRIEGQIDKADKEINELNAKLGRPTDEVWYQARLFKRTGNLDSVSKLL